jgi:3-deoxy-D-manno-octulosonic-acid transferase/heptosyltransferase-1
LAFIRGLRAVRYDLVLDLQGLLKSGVIVGLARAGEKIGLSLAREHADMFYDKVIHVDMERHALLRTLDVARALGAERITTDAMVHLTDQEKEAFERRFQELGLIAGGYVVMNPVAKWDTKLWVRERFSRLGDRIIAETGLELVFTGSRADRTYVEDIIKGMRQRAIDLVGKVTLRELAYLMEGARLTVSTDTGPMHLAASVGCPVVAIFGPTAEWRTGPFGNGHRVVKASVPCSPCFKRTCRDMQCMDKIQVEDVFQNVMELLEEDHDRQKTT